MMIRVGIDVGGANTDVVMDGSNVLARVKSPLASSGLAPQAIDAVMIATTHFTNAVVQRRDLAPTAAVRLGLPATASLPPMVDWPEDLRGAIGNHATLTHGGHECDGPRDFAARRTRTPADRRRYQTANATRAQVKVVNVVGDLHVA
jgi:N-methylhydantoinase A/oxoprolinase/acetone carboxylase beta subunit